MTDQHADELLQGLLQWADDYDDEAPLEPAYLVEIRSLVSRAVTTQDRATLDLLRSRLTPVAARLRAAAAIIPAPRRQAHELACLSAQVHAALFIIEKDDPVTAARHINHGEAILRILTGEKLRDEAGVNLRTIRRHWEPPEQAPSIATISRALAALEEAGFVQRHGATKGLRVRLLPKAHTWRRATAPAAQPSARAGSAAAASQPAGREPAATGVAAYRPGADPMLTAADPRLLPGLARPEPPAVVEIVGREVSWQPAADFRQQVAA